MWVLPQVFIVNEDPHPVTQYIGAMMFSLILVCLVSLVLVYLVKERSFKKFVSMVVMVHAGVYSAAVAAFGITYIAGLYMIAHSPQDNITAMLLDLLNGYAITITVLGVVVYGLRSIGLFIISHSIRNESEIGILAGTVIVLITSISI